MLSNPLDAAAINASFDKAARILEQSVASGQVRAAAIHVQSGSMLWSRSLGEAKTANASFLLGSISKPIAIAALMTLYDTGMFDLQDLAQKYLPEFTGGWRDESST
jgi:CubicO group peptidase (beta-lactamase class C family)